MGDGVRTMPVTTTGIRRIALVASFVLVVATTMTLPAEGASEDVTVLHQSDFEYGTYIIDQPGVYRLGEDISFNPNSPATLTSDIADGTIPSQIAAALGLPYPVDAYRSSMPLFTQLAVEETGPFTPGGPLDARYDPAAYGVGFFAALAVEADGVVIDLNGHTIEQSAEHALLQRFFAVIELADQPFIPAQGPAGFGDEIVPAKNVVIKNGTIGRSSHHGIHGNANENIKVRDVHFDDYEVGAVALNGVKGLTVVNVTATNRKDVPVLGTFSSAQFIKAYIDDLVHTGSTTTLTVDDVELSAGDIQVALREVINNTHHDVIVEGEGFIDETSHPLEYGLFHNPHGVIDGNSYSFLVNAIGVAVNGFPTVPDDDSGAERVRFRNVVVTDQHSFINEVPAVDTNGSAPGGKAVIDPVGAVFQIKNVHPDTGIPVTVSSLDDHLAEYTGNPVANAQAFVAKAASLGDLGSGRLDISRLNIPGWLLSWVEGEVGSETLASVGTTYFCNGDSMFHVNKGAIAFKMDAATDVRLKKSGVDGLVNLGAPGTALCGDYSNSKSHPDATLLGYGGAAVRAFTFAGSTEVSVKQAWASGLSSMAGPAIGFAVMTDSSHVSLKKTRTSLVDAGWGDMMPAGAPNNEAYAAGVYVGEGVHSASVVRGCEFCRDEGY